jgi:hypothetical protein
MLYSPEEIDKFINDLHRRSLKVDDPRIKAIYSDIICLAQTTQLQIRELQNILFLPETKSTKAPTDNEEAEKKDV